MVDMRHQVAGKQPRIDVVARADADADHEPQRLAAEEGGDVFLRTRRASGDKGHGESEQSAFHCCGAAS